MSFTPPDGVHVVASGRVRRALPGLCLILSAFALESSAQTLQQRAARLHESAIIVDTHEDVPEQVQKEWIDLGVRSKIGHVDIPRLKEGGITASFFAAYVPAAFATSGGSAKKALELIDLIHRLIDTHSSELVFADSVTAVRSAKKDGKIAVLIGVEGGHAIEDSLGALSAFARLGARYMTLTHTNSNHWADSSGSFFTYGFDPKKYALHNGLTGFGREVVLEMNRLGMMVDVSHVSDKTVEDVLAVSQAPVFASHSSCRALADMPRNLSDAQIRAIAGKGGMVMINFSSAFLDQRVIDDYKAKKKAAESGIAAIAERFRDDPKRRDAEITTAFNSIERLRAPWTAVVDHIEHVWKIAGPRSVGLGTDYDGIDDPPVGLEDVSKLPRITEELLRRGHSEEEVRGVLGENFLSFWERAERARQAMPPRAEPLPFSKP